jgi:hypothetical protein
MDQLQEAVRQTKARITTLEIELMRERDFLRRLVPPPEVSSVPPRKNTNNWSIVLAHIQHKPLKYEYICDFIDEQGLSIKRGAIRAGLFYHVKRGNLERLETNHYALTERGAEYLRR